MRDSVDEASAPGMNALVDTASQAICLEILAAATYLGETLVLAPSFSKRTNLCQTAIFVDAGVALIARWLMGLINTSTIFINYEFAECAKNERQK